MMQTDMIIKKYTFGGVCFEIRSELPLLTVPKYEEFLSDDTAKSDYIFEIIPDRTNSTSLSGTVREGNRFRFTVSEKYISGLGVGHVLSSANAAYVFPDHDGFILHASYILYRGEAILFSAPSGTGKSTQAAFWKEHRGAEIINGDRVLVIKRDGVFYACGVYVSGTSGICRNSTAPLRNLVILEQGENNELVPLKARELFLRILCQCTFDMHDHTQYGKITELVSDVINTVPVCCYRCRCNPDSVEELERLLWNKK